MPPAPAKTEFRLDHVAVGVPRAAEATPFLVGELGGRRHASGPGMGFRFWQYRYEGGGVLELLEPDGPPGGFLHRFLDRRGPGVHHVTFKVPDIHVAMGRAKDLGYEIVHFNDDFPGWKEAFLHPKQAQGIVVQLAQAEGDDPLDETQWPFPAEPVRAETSTLIGVRLAARDEEAVLRQWQTLLGGVCEQRGGELHFRWSESPLRIAVAIDPGAPEGPRALEIAPADGVALPESPHPVLGAAFVAAARAAS